MAAVEMSCHLVDFSSLKATSVSLTLGYLQAFAEADPRISGRCQFSKQCRHVRGALEPGWQTIQTLIDRDQAEKRVFAFTNYFWNRPLNLKLASRIKSVLPDALVVFGGNDVTDQGQTILGAESPVDIVVNGEGELIFANVLAAHLESGKDFSKIRGVSFRDEEGRIVTTEAQPRIDNLDSIPSPFLSGACSVQELKSSYELVYEFSRGCPFKCAFCFWGGAVGTRTRRFSLERIRQDLEFIISRANNGTRIWAADANFGMTDADVEVARILVGLVEKYKKPFYMFTSWAKNTSRRVVEAATILYRGRLIPGVTLSAQSMNPEVLEIAERKNIPFEYYRELQDQFHRLGIPTYTELIFGMPGESYESFRQGVEKVMYTGGTPVLYPLMILNNTEYSDPKIRNEYQIKTRMMPYYIYDQSSPAEAVIGHSKLPYEDWLRGIGLRLVAPLFYSGILKFVMTRLYAVHGISYGKMLDRLLDYCMKGEVKSHDLFRRIFLNYIASWDSPDRYDAKLIKEVLQGNDPHDFVHFQALMTVIMKDIEAAKILVAEFSRLLAQEVDADLSSEFDSWVEYQQLILEAMSQAAHGRPGTVNTELEISFLGKYAGEHVAQEENNFRRLHVRREYSSASLDVFIFRINYGNMDTLRMFESHISKPSLPGSELQSHASTVAVHQ